MHVAVLAALAVQEYLPPARRTCYRHVRHARACRRPDASDAAAASLLPPSRAAPSALPPFPGAQPASARDYSDSACDCWRMTPWPPVRAPACTIIYRYTCIRYFLIYFNFYIYPTLQLNNKKKNIITSSARRPRMERAVHVAKAQHEREANCE
jgi:hypothetical protein